MRTQNFCGNKIRIHIDFNLWFFILFHFLAYISGFEDGSDPKTAEAGSKPETVKDVNDNIDPAIAEKKCKDALDLKSGLLLKISKLGERLPKNT